MISVVIPLYNKEKQIAHTLQSVFNQTFQNFEVVIVDDGSTDGSVAEVEKLSDSRIRLIHQKNAGVSAARNRGIEEAKGDLIAFLDADDEWKPEYLATQYHLSQKYPNCSVFACNYEFRNMEGKVTPTIIRKLPFTGEDGILSNYFEVASCSHPPICSISIMVRKSAIQAIGGFPVGIKSGEDLLTWARLAVNDKIAYSKKAQSVYNLPILSATGNARDCQIEDIKGCPDSIGLEIEGLYRKATGPLKREIRLYLSFWYKMRASINLSLGYKIPALSCTNRSLFFNPFNWKVYTFYIVALVPLFITKKLLYYCRK